MQSKLTYKQIKITKRYFIQSTNYKEKTHNRYTKDKKKRVKANYYKKSLNDK